MQQLGYRPDIDGLRAIAVLLVLVFHFDLFGAGKAGFIGVDIFFVISGYLISSICWRDLERGRFSLVQFYARRIRRLAPALVAVQLLVLAAGAIALLPDQMRALGKESFFVQTYLSNIYYWQTINYFGINAGGAYMLHSWSLGVEEQFYLFYPLFLLLVHRFARRWLAAALILLCLVSFGLNLAILPYKPEAVFYLLPTRAWELGLGALIPFLEPRVAASQTLRNALAPAGLALIAGALVFHNAGTPFPGWFALLPTGAAVMMILAGTGSRSFVSRQIGHALPVWIGKISYPLYLVHWPLIIFGRQLLPDYGPAARWSLFLLSFLLAWAIYRFVEERVRHGRAFESPRRVFLAYGLVLAVMLGICISAWTSGGWRGRFAPEVARIDDVARDRDPETLRHEYKEGPIADKFRRIGAPGVTPRWFLYGDSHAAALTRAFSLFLEKRGEAGIVLFRPACLPALDTGDKACRALNRGVIDYLRQDPDIANVVLVSIWRQPLEPGFRDPSGQVVTGNAAIQSFDTALTGTLQALQQTGVRTFVWRPLPSMPLSVPTAMARNLAWGIDLPTSIPLAKHRETFAFFDRIVTREHARIAGTIAPEAELCRDGICRGQRDGIPLYNDSNHPAYSQSPLFAGIVEKQLAGVPAPARR